MSSLYRKIDSFIFQQFSSNFLDWRMMFTSFHGGAASAINCKPTKMFPF